MDRRDRPRVVTYVVDAGGGHRAAANSLVAANALRGNPFDLDVASLQDVLAPLDLLKRVWSVSIQDAYNALLRTRRTGHLAPLLRLLHMTIRLRRRALVARVAADVATRRPDAVVSVVPNFNGVIRDAVAAVSPSVPFLVVLTDFADLPPRFWIESGVTRVLVGTDRAADQARALGVPEDRVHRTTGMVLHPRFYPRRAGDAPVRLRRELGLRADAKVVLVMFGGNGSEEMRPLVTALLARDPAWQVVAMCGRSPRLVEELTLLAGSSDRLRTVGFTDRVADYLAVADVLVTKPGPGALAEAFHQRVPVVVSLDRRTIPQERYNAVFVEERGLGLVARTRAEMTRGAARLVHDSALRGRVLASLGRLPENRAVFEVLDLVGKALGRGTGLGDRRAADAVEVTTPPTPPVVEARGAALS